MKNLKKTISIILCLVMALSLSITAIADDKVTTQTEEVTAVSDTAETPATETETPATETETPATETETPATETETPTTETETPTTETETPVTETETPVTETPVVETPEVQEPVVETPVANNGEITVKVNGVAVVFEDVKPQIIDGRTLVPFRKVGEALNAAVAWRSTDRTVHCFRNGTSIMMTLDESNMEVRQYEMGEKFVYTTEAVVSPIDPDQPSVKAITINDRTMIPIRAAAEALGAKVDWDGATSTVIIDIPAYNLTLADKDAANLVEKWNYKPATELKNGSVAIKVYGNFMGATSELGDGVVVKLDGNSATAAEGGACAFADVKAGTYTITVENIPEGYVIQNTDVLTFEVKASEETTVRIALVKAEEVITEETENK